MQNFQEISRCSFFKYLISTFRMPWRSKECPNKSLYETHKATESEVSVATIVASVGKKMTLMSDSS